MIIMIRNREKQMVLHFSPKMKIKENKQTLNRMVQKIIIRQGQKSVRNYRLRDFNFERLRLQKTLKRQQKLDRKWNKKIQQSIKRIQEINQKIRINSRLYKQKLKGNTDQNDFNKNEKIQEEHQKKQTFQDLQALTQRFQKMNELIKKSLTEQNPNHHVKILNINKNQLLEQLNKADEMKKKIKQVTEKFQKQKNKKALKQAQKKAKEKTGLSKKNNDENDSENEVLDNQLPKRRY